MRRTRLAFDPAARRADAAGSARFELRSRRAGESTLYVDRRAARSATSAPPRAAPTTTRCARAGRALGAAASARRCRIAHVQRRSSTTGSTARVADLHMMITDDAARAVSLRRRALVQHAVRPRRHHHRAARCCGSSPSSRAACSAYLAATQATDVDPEQRRRARQDPARGARRRDGGARRGAVRPLLRQRRRDAAVRDAGRRLLRSAPATSRSSQRSGRNIERALDWIDGYGDRDGDGFVEYARADADGPACSRAGRTRTTRSSTPTARWPRGRSRCARCRATSTPRSAAAAELARGARATRRAADELRRAGATRCASASSEAFWCEELGTYALALDGDKRPCRGAHARTPGHCSVHRHRRAGARARASPRRCWRRQSFSGWGIRTLAADRGALQPDVVPQRLGLAARQRAHRRRASPATASHDAALRVLDGLFDASAARRPAPAAGAVLRLPAPRRARGRRSIRWRARRRPGRRRGVPAAAARRWASSIDGRARRGRRSATRCCRRASASCASSACEVGDGSRRPAAREPPARRRRDRAAPRGRRPRRRGEVGRSRQSEKARGSSAPRRGALAAAPRRAGEQHLGVGVARARRAPGGRRRTGVAGGRRGGHDGDGADRSRAGGDRGGDGVALGADREAVGGVLDVAADVDAARARRARRRRR